MLLRFAAQSRHLKCGVHPNPLQALIAVEPFHCSKIDFIGSRKGVATPSGFKILGVFGIGRHVYTPFAHKLSAKTLGFPAVNCDPVDEKSILLTVKVSRLNSGLNLAQDFSQKLLVA